MSFFPSEQDRSMFLTCKVCHEQYVDHVGYALKCVWGPMCFNNMPYVEPELDLLPDIEEI